MNKFIQTVLENKEIKTKLLDFKQDYKDSDYPAEMKEMSKSANKKESYLAAHTQWYFVNNKNVLFGVMGRYIVTYSVKEGFKYLCDGFRNIPLEHIASFKKNTCPDNIKEAYLSYQKLCQNYGMELSEVHHEEAFNKYLKDRADIS